MARGDLIHNLELPLTPDGQLDVAVFNRMFQLVQERVNALEGRSQPSQIRDDLEVLGDVTAQGLFIGAGLNPGQGGVVAPLEVGRDGEMTAPLLPYTLVQTDPLGQFLPLVPSLFVPTALDTFFSMDTAQPGDLAWNLSGAVVTLPSAEPGHDGIITLTTTGGGAVSVEGVVLNGVSIPNIGYLGFVIKTGSTVADTSLRFGALRNPFGGTVDEGTQGVYFSYVSSTSGFWRTVTRTAGAGNITVNETTIPVVADSWYVLEMVVNTDAASVDFYINRARAFRHSTNILSAAVPLAPAVVVQHNNGPSASVSIDTFLYIAARPVVKLWS